jgi:hypothetical protein
VASLRARRWESDGRGGAGMGARGRRGRGEETAKGMAPSRIREGSQIRNGESDPLFRQPARWAPHVRHGKHDVDGVGGHF